MVNMLMKPELSSEAAQPPVTRFGSIDQTNTYAAAPIPHIRVTLGLGQLDAVGRHDKRGGRLRLRSRKVDDRQPWGGAMPLAQLSIVDG